MSQSSPNATPPSAIHYHKQSKILDLTYGDETYSLTAELLRVCSPSAEVQGHGNPVLQTGKKFVGINGMEPVGHYALKIIFDDGHDSGIFSWDYLKKLCENQEQYWEDYLKRLHEQGGSRDPAVSVVKFVP